MACKTLLMTHRVRCSSPPSRYGVLFTRRVRFTNTPRARGGVLEDPGWLAREGRGGTDIDYSLLDRVIGVLSHILLLILFNLFSY